MFNVFGFLLIGVIILVQAECAVAGDPTRPSHYKTKSPEKTFQLDSILFSKTRKVAVINGAVVSEGDSVEGAKIVAIDKNRVRINHNGKLIELVLHSTTIRQEN